VLSGIQPEEENMGRNESVKATAQGLFFRNIGYTESGSPCKFYLGTERNSAKVACERLELLEVLPN
jgi:hypothetical protein